MPVGIPSGRAGPPPAGHFLLTDFYVRPPASIVHSDVPHAEARHLRGPSHAEKRQSRGDGPPQGHWVVQHLAQADPARSETRPSNCLFQATEDNNGAFSSVEWIHDLLNPDQNTPTRGDHSALKLARSPLTTCQ